MDDFKKLQEELPSITQKVKLADESINLANLTDKEKQDTFIRLVFLRDATISLIEKLQADLNKHAGRVWVGKPTPVMTIVQYGGLEGIKDMLDAVFGQFGNAPEETGDDTNNGDVDGER